MSNVNETPYMIGRRIAVKTMDAIAMNTDRATSSVSQKSSRPPRSQNAWGWGAATFGAGAILLLVARTRIRSKTE